MPRYCYTTKGGVTVEKFFPFGKAPETIRVNGRVARRDFRAEHVGTRHPGNWPMESFSLGVEPSQVKEAEAESIKIGVPTHFNPVTGDAILTSPTHRRAYAEKLGFFDRNGGYSDPQRK